MPAQIIARGIRGAGTARAAGGADGAAPVPVQVDLRLDARPGGRRLTGTLRGEPADLARLAAAGRLLVALGDGECPCRCTGLSADGGELAVESTGLLPVPTPQGQILQM